VTRQDIADALAQYRAGLQTGIGLLRQLDAVASRQRAGTETRDFKQLAAEADARERLTRALVSIEPGLRDVRAFLSTLPDAALEDQPDYPEVTALRQTAADLVAAILKTDGASMRALAEAELAHRAAIANLECGEATLAAYRRVLTPPVASASLLDVRG
jgi:hypothetical protein